MLGDPKTGFWELVINPLYVTDPLPRVGTETESPGFWGDFFD
jgi:hypothetical protein